MRLVHNPQLTVNARKKRASAIPSIWTSFEERSDLYDDSAPLPNDDGAVAALRGDG